MGVPTHIPFWQLSPMVQMLPSSHAVPLVTYECEHIPVEGAQESLVQGLLSSQLTGRPGRQRPPWQVSRPSHSVALSHDVPSAAGPCTHEPPLLESVVQGSLSLQSMGVPR